jgi:uncharacterized protein YndB with AHSA1/START domain/GNAT superfamily N-acetyltransferase
MASIGRSDTGDEEAQEELPGPDQGEIALEPLNLVANVSDERMYSWESQAAQYPPTGPPGFAYVRGNVSDEVYVDCLLYHDENGELVGILNRYPMDIPPHEREGDQNIWVRPDRRRQGIGSALTSEAFVRWGPGPNAGDAGALKLTESGVQLLQGMEEKRSIARRVLPAPPDVVYGEWLNAEGMYAWVCSPPAVPTHIEIDPQVGGQYRIDMDDEGLARSVAGRYFVFREPDGLAFTWRCSTWEASTPDSVVIVQLEPHDDHQTLMTIRHGRLPADLRDGYTASWRRIAAQLAERLSGR